MKVDEVVAHLGTAWRCARRADMKPRAYGPFPYSPIIRRPRLTWPNGAHVALWVIPNIEYFSLEERPGGYGGGGKIPDVVMWSDARLRQPRRRVAPDGGARPLRHPRHRRAQQPICATHHPIIMEEGNKRNWEWMGHNESNTRRLNEAPPGEEANIIKPHLRDDRARDRQAGRRAGSAPACRRPGTRSTCWRRRAANTCATGATTTSPM